MRKRILLTAIAAIMGTAVSIAQQIAVVSESGTTDVYQTLQEAIEGASNGSVIYLPGGGFQIHDSVKITKRLSIIGIGHKAKNENVDGNTVIAGSLFFNQGANNSSVMGCYISGNVNIGKDGNSVNNFTIKYCNLNSVQVGNNLCSGTIANQNYIRSTSSFNQSPAIITNNVMFDVQYVNGGVIANNILNMPYMSDRIDSARPLYNNPNTSILYNIVLHWKQPFARGCSNSQIVGNMAPVSFGEDCIIISNVDITDIFINPKGISSVSDFHFKEAYQQYQSQVGIYGGDGFSDGALPPVPFIVSKSVPEQTDASGKLNIKIRVKAGE